MVIVKQDEGETSTILLIKFLIDKVLWRSLFFADTK